MNPRKPRENAVIPQAGEHRRHIASECTGAVQEGGPPEAWCVPPSGDALHVHCRAILEMAEPRWTQVRIRQPEGPELDLRLESRTGSERDTLCMALIDVTEQERVKAEIERARANLEDRVLERTAQLAHVNAALAESEERFRKLADNAHDVVFKYRLRPEPALEYVSPSVTAMTGHPPEAFYEDPALPFALIAEEDRERIRSRAALDRAVESRLLNAKGRERWIETRASGVYDGEGHLVAIEGICRDVTDRKRSETALRNAYDGLGRRVHEHNASLVRANEELVGEIAKRRRAEKELRHRDATLQAIVETAVDGILGLDEKGAIESFNPAAERIFGYSAAAVIGRNVDLLIVPPDGDEPARLFARLVGRGSDLIGRRKNGSTFPVLVRVGEVREGGVRFVCIIRDTSHEQRSSEALRRSQES